MRLILALIVHIICINEGTGYFFPLCVSKNDKSCTNFFNLPTLSVYNIPFLNDDHQKQEVSVEQGPKNQVVLPYGIDNAIHTLSVCYRENVQPVMSHCFKMAVEYMPVFKEQCGRLLSNLPFFKEQRVKADSRLYFLFIVVSVLIYLGLYIYFTRKLYYYYQGALRQQYLNNVKKIFKTKD